jgi:osmoprotectant transport system substrate-binding protein
MRLSRTLALGASMLVLFGACSTGGGSSTPTAAAPTATPAAASSTPASTPTAAPPTIKIGSAGFYEAKIMAEIYAQALEAHGYTVDRAAIGLGTRPNATNPALLSGQIDLEPEYIGSELASFEPGKQTGDPNANMTELQNVLNTKGGGITALTFSPAADQNAFVVRSDTATSLNLAKMSDTTAVQDQLKWGLATDCKTNPVCAAALKTAYGLAPKSVTYLSACDTPMAQALLAKTIDVGELCSTQPDIAQNGWVVLQDDKATQPADNISPLVRNDYLAKLGDKAGFEAILNAVSAKMDTATLTKLNADFTVQKQDIATIAKAWLSQAGLVP